MFAKRIMAHRKVIAALLDDIEDLMVDLDVEFFNANSMVVVTIDDQDTVNQVVEALDKKYELKISSPSVIRRAAFALVGPEVTVRRVGTVLQVYRSR